MELKTNYEWRDITGDGILREPCEQGPHYDRDNVNQSYGSYETEDEAVEGLKKFLKSHPYANGEFVLVKVYSSS